MQKANWFKSFAAVVGLGTLMMAGVAMADDVVKEARDALPAQVRDSGKLKVATSLTWAPFAYKSEDDDAVGIDVGLMKLLASKLGLDPVIDDIKFPAIVPGVTTGRYDVGLNGIDITEERLKVVDMVPYFTSGSAVLVKKGATNLDPNNLCGVTLAVTQGSAQEQMIDSLSQKCVAAGKKEIAQEMYPDTAATLLAVANGRGDGFLTATPQGAYVEKTDTKLAMVPGEVKDLPRSVTGFAISKGNEAMHKALTLAMESAIKDGSYHKLLEEYGVGDLGISVETLHTPAEKL
jgi:polar amino acid transport system substrate-binding protein